MAGSYKERQGRERPYRPHLSQDTAGAAGLSQALSQLNLVFKSFGADKPISNGYIRKLLKHALQKTGLDTEYTTHGLCHSFVTHLLEAGEDIRTVQQRLGHKSVQTTMIYLHLAKIERRQCVYLIETIFK